MPDLSLGSWFVSVNVKQRYLQFSKTESPPDQEGFFVYQCDDGGT